MSSELEYTDVWTFPSVRPYTGKHPAEKPLEMLAHIINASTFEGDIVLDCFAGSGATAVATLMSNRLAVGMEIEDRWVKRAVERVAQAEAVAPHTTLSEARSRRRDLEHASLF